jgi:hypothetical protein
VQRLAAKVQGETTIDLRSGDGERTVDGYLIMQDRFSPPNSGIPAAAPGASKRLLPDLPK